MKCLSPMVFMVGVCAVAVSCSDPVAPAAPGQNAVTGQATEAFRIHLSPSRGEPGHLLRLSTGNIGIFGEDRALTFAMGLMRTDEILATLKDSADGRLLVLLTARARLDGDQWSVEGELWCQLPVRFGVEDVAIPVITCDGSVIQNDSVVEPGTYALNVAGTIAK